MAAGMASLKVHIKTKHKADQDLIAFTCQKKQIKPQVDLQTNRTQYVTVHFWVL